MEEEGKGKKVCVTGGTGYLGSWMIKRLLQLGYSVNTTIRSPPPHDNKRDVSFLTSLPGAAERLKIFNADLTEPSSFETAIEGCIGVFLVAHPVDIDEPEEVKTSKSISGTIGILKACLKSKTVGRVVYTSSASTVVFNDKTLENGPLDESTWSDPNFIRDNKLYGASYFISKILTERAAIEFAQEHGLDLVTVIPSFILGPFLCPSCPGSVYICLAMIFGDKKMYEFLTISKFVHVDDVANAHIFLLENGNAKGRYICSAAELTIYDISIYLSTNFPEYQIPNADSLKEFEGLKCGALSSKKLLDSGFKFKYSIDEMFKQAIQCCKEKGIL